MIELALIVHAAVAALIGVAVLVLILDGRAERRHRRAIERGSLRAAVVDLRTAVERLSPRSASRLLPPHHHERSIPAVARPRRRRRGGH